MQKWAPEIFGNENEGLDTARPLKMKQGQDDPVVPFPKMELARFTPSLSEKETVPGPIPPKWILAPS